MESDARFWEKGKKKKDRRKKIKEWWGHKNMLVSNSYVTNVMKWLMGRVFVLKHIPRSVLSLLALVKLFISQSLRTLSFHYLSKKNLFASVLSSTQVQTRFYFLPAHIMCVYSKERTHQLHSEPCAVWATEHEELACMCACMRAEMFTFPLCLKHMDWGGMCGGKERSTGRVRGWAEAVIWEGYPTAQAGSRSLHTTTGPAHMETHTDGKDPSINCKPA